MADGAAAATSGVAVDDTTARTPPHAPVLASETHQVRNPRDPRRWPRILAVVPGVVGAALLAAQFVLPALAASVIRHRLGRDGIVERVHVSAFPAVELLWGHADAVQIHLEKLDVSVDRATELAGQAYRVDDAEVAIDALHEGALTVHHVRARLHQAQLSVSAALATKDLQHALPPQLTLSAHRGSAGRLVVRTTAGILGTRIGIDAIVSAQDGALVASPTLPLLGNFLTFTLFSDPRIGIESIRATPRSDGYHVTLSARVPRG